MAIRLQDIADDLKLSKMTISKVLRGQTDVSAETKARVLKRMQELNYRPNISARGLRTGQTFTIGLVVPGMDDPAVSQIVAGVNEAVRPDGYSVVISSADLDPEFEEREVELQLSRQVDALLICLRSDASDVPQILQSTNVPVALLGHAPPRFSGFNVGIRENEVGLIAVQHLIERKCRRIAYLRGPRTPIADLRFDGFLEAMRNAGLPVRQEWIIETQRGADGYRNGVDAMRRFSTARTGPDGVIAYTDIQAMGLRDAALEAGLELLKDVQIMGCGNVTELCETGISLTSIELPHREIGKRAARMVLRAIEEKGSSNVQRNTLLSPRVVQRYSTRDERYGERKKNR